MSAFRQGEGRLTRIRWISWGFGEGQVCVLKSRWVSPPNPNKLTGKGEPSSTQEATFTDCLLPPCPAPTANQKNQFGSVRSARSVSASSTPLCGNALIVFDFSTHRHRHSHHRFGRRFGMEKLR